MEKLIYIFFTIICISACSVFPKHPLVIASANFESITDLDAALNDLEVMHVSNGFRKAPFVKHAWQLTEGNNLAFHLSYTIEGKVLYVRLVSHNFSSSQTKVIANRIKLYLGSRLSSDSFEFKYIEQSSPFT